MKIKHATIGSLVTLALVLSSAPVHATAILDFGVIAPTSGMIKYPVLNGTLQGIGIDVDNITGLPGGPTVTCVSCILTFTTGAATPGTWNFGGGARSMISIIGGVDLTGDLDANDALDIPVGTALLTGNFGDATVISTGGTFKIAGASFFDVKDPQLLAFFGLPNVPYLGNFNISFAAAGAPPGTFISTTVFSGDIVNTPTPEPGTIMLLGSGLSGFGYLVIRRRRKSHRDL